MDMPYKQRNINAGHRTRMREKYMQGSIEAFLPHEALEMLLYWPIAYKDTNPIAHRLIENFGSFDEVMQGSVEELCQVDGVGEQTAVFLQLVNEIGVRGMVEDNPDAFSIPNSKALLRFAQACVVDEVNSCTYAIFINNRFELIQTLRLEENAPLGVPFEFKELADLSLEIKASMVAVVMHRSAKLQRLSRHELEFISDMDDKLRALGIKLLNFYAICGSHHYSWTAYSSQAYISNEPAYAEFYAEELARLRGAIDE